MEMFARFNYKKILFTTLIIISIPIWLPILNYIFDFILESGRIMGSLIRAIGSEGSCIL